MTFLAILPTLGTSEILLILLVGLVLFGGRLPEVGKSIGKSLVEFRKGLRNIKDEAGLGEIEKVRDELRDLAKLPSPDFNFPDYQDNAIDVEGKPVQEDPSIADLSRAASKGTAEIQESNGEVLPGEGLQQSEQNTGQEPQSDPPSIDVVEEEGERKEEDRDPPQPFGYSR